MRLSTRGRYGLRAMVDLALHYGQGPVALKSIADRQNVSDHYLEQLMGSLRKAGLVSSVRGAQGGYELVRRPAEITVGDVVRALEGPIAPVECVSEAADAASVCGMINTCVTRLVWAKLRDSIAEVLDSITLEDLCAEARELQSKQDAFMYYI
ncbi:MAG: Rrf2 family transcriptional regulator [Bacillota bacterium]|nr:Rrf2 family transcriptional regulator [Bacillota bacterium]